MGRERMDCSLTGVSGGQTNVTFEPKQSGLQARDLVRWVATSGAVGPWGERVWVAVVA